VQDAPQWTTAVRLIAAGLGVSIAPACVSSLTMPNVVYRRLRTTHRTSVDIGMRRDFHSPVAAAFLAIIREQFSAE
jgi:DNA-binding transcriptional LysR family regulator